MLRSPNRRSAGRGGVRGPIAPSSTHAVPAPEHELAGAPPERTRDAGRQRVRQRSAAQHGGARYPACNHGPMTAAPSARVVQITDTHLSPRLGVPPQWPALVDWLADNPADLVVHSGDIVYRIRTTTPTGRSPAGSTTTCPVQWRSSRATTTSASTARRTSGRSPAGGVRRHVGWRPLRRRPPRLARGRRRRRTCSARRSTTNGWRRRSTLTDRASCSSTSRSGAIRRTSGRCRMRPGTRSTGRLRAATCGRWRAGTAIAAPSSTALWAPSLTLVGDSDDGIERRSPTGVRGVPPLARRCAGPPRSCGRGSRRERLGRDHRRPGRPRRPLPAHRARAGGPARPWCSCRTGRRRASTSAGADREPGRPIPAPGEPRPGRSTRSASRAAARTASPPPTAWPVARGAPARVPCGTRGPARLGRAHRAGGGRSSISAAAALHQSADRRVRPAGGGARPAGRRRRRGRRRAGTGAVAGGLQGGVGTAAFDADGIVVGALAVVNAAGSRHRPGVGLPWCTEGFDLRRPPAPERAAAPDGDDATGPGRGVADQHHDRRGRHVGRG